jgi:chromate transporter
MATPRSKGRLFELALLFLKLGTIGFGGPAAHIALMRDEVVARKKWVSEQRFLDLVGATNLIPGPNSTELAAHIGRERAGWRGLVIAGVAFIFPAMLIVLGLAWLYLRYDTSPAADALIYGVSPVVIAIIVFAVWGLAKTAGKTPILLGWGLAAFVLYLLGVNELLLLGGSAVLSSLLGRSWRPRSIGVFVTAVPASVIAVGSSAVDLGRLFVAFLKFGSIVFGSGYVLLAFLRADLVVRLGWVTSEQLIDAVAIGQMTPGPVFTAATFIGYLVAGVPGALLATLGIFLPSFLFVALLNPLVRKIRESTLLASMLDGLNVGALGLMAGVTVQLGRESLVDPITISIAVISAGIIFLWRPNNVWLIVAGAAVGILRTIL